jgi:hypothetical protein
MCGSSDGYVLREGEGVKNHVMFFYALISITMKETCFSLVLGLLMAIVLVLSLSGVIEGVTNTPTDTPPPTTPPPTTPSGGSPKDTQKDIPPSDANKPSSKTAFKWATGTYDSSGNTIQTLNSVGMGACINMCKQTPKCVGFVSDFLVGNGPGNCWLKSDFGNPKPQAAQPLYSYFVTRTT